MNLNIDWSQLSPFYRDTYEKRKAEWARQDKDFVLDQLKFFRGLRAVLVEDLRLNVWPGDDSVLQVTQIIRYYMGVLTSGKT